MSRNHPLIVPEGLQEFAQQMARSILFQCDEKTFLLHGAIRVPEVQEYEKEGVLVYSRKLLGEL